jgi:hypothetical protein
MSNDARYALTIFVDKEIAFKMFKTKYRDPNNYWCSYLGAYGMDKTWNLGYGATGWYYPSGRGPSQIKQTVEFARTVLLKEDEPFVSFTGDDATCTKVEYWCPKSISVAFEQELRTFLKNVVARRFV